MDIVKKYYIKKVQMFWKKKQQDFFFNFKKNFKTYRQLQLSVKFFAKVSLK